MKRQLSSALLMLTVFMVQLLSALGSVCSECKTYCRKDQPDRPERLRVVRTTINRLVSHGRGCQRLRELSSQWNVSIYAGSIRDIGSTPYATKFLEKQTLQQYSEMLEFGDNTLEVLELNAPYLSPLEHHLEVIPDVDTQYINPKWKHYTRFGDLVSVAHRANQLVMFYRGDLLSKYGLPIPTENWAEFTKTVRQVQEMEGKIGGFSFGFSDSESRMSALISFLSGVEGSGGVVEPDGTVSINNPAAIETLRLIRGWVGDIVPDTILETSESAARDQFFAGKFFCTLTWSSNTKELWKKAPKDYNITLGPVPGRFGAGTNGGWSTALSKYTEHKDFGVAYIRKMASASIDFHVFQHDQEPLDIRVRQDPKRWKAYKRKNPYISTSIETFPEFWTRLVNRPSAGCGTLYPNCQDEVGSELENLITGRNSPEEAAASMESALKITLGTWQPDSLYGEEETWTTTAIIMVVSIASSLFVLLVVGFVVLVQIRNMRRAEGFKIPVSVMLGFVVGVSLVIVCVVATREIRNTTKEISQDLSNQVRTLSLRSMQTGLEASLHGMLLSTKPYLSLVDIKKLASARARTMLGTLQLDPRSLVVILDRRNGEVLVSSDPKRQREFFFVPDPLKAAEGRNVSGWLYAGLTNIPLPDGSIAPDWHKAIVDDTKTVPLVIDGVPVKLNLKRVDQESEGREVKWLVLYFVPDRVIMEDADNAVRRQMKLNISLSVVAVALAVACTVVITFPLVTLARDMERVCLLDMENIDMTQQSMLTELSSLFLGFQTMSSMMLEYKAYMPKTIFTADDTVDDEEAENSVGQKTGSSKSQTSSSNRTPSTLVAQGNPGISKRNVGVGKLQPVRGTVAVVRLEEYEKLFAEGADKPDVFMAAVSLAESVCTGLKGTLHPFNTMMPGELTMSWGMVPGVVVPTAAEKACTAAMHFRDFGERCSVVLSGGRCRAGNIGTQSTRGFGLAGSAVNVGWEMADLARRLVLGTQENVVLASPEVVDKVRTVYSTRYVDILVVQQRNYLVSQVLRATRLQAEEWMYQLEHIGQEKKDPLSTFIAAVEADGKLAQHLSGAPRTPDDDKISSFAFVRMEALARSRATILFSGCRSLLLLADAYLVQ